MPEPVACTWDGLVVYRCMRCEGKTVVIGYHRSYARAWGQVTRTVPSSTYPGAARRVWLCCWDTECAKKLPIIPKEILVSATDNRCFTWRRIRQPKAATRDRIESVFRLGGHPALVEIGYSEAYWYG